MNRVYPEHLYNGYTLNCEEDIEYGEEGPENIKIYHWIKMPGGGEQIMDWSPYSVPTFEEFKLWIDLGRPDRFDKAFGEKYCWGPLDVKDLRTIHNVRFSTPIWKQSKQITFVIQVKHPSEF